MSLVGVVPVLLLVLFNISLMQAQPNEEGWVSLFEGVSKRGWTQEGDSDWAVVDGRLTGTHGRILNRWCWVDFELSFQFEGKGTLLFRVGSDQMGHIGFGQTGYRIDLNSKGKASTAAESARLSSAPLPPKSLHNVQITVTGEEYRLLVDNRTVQELTEDSSPSKGRIGFEASGDPFSVQSVRIRPLNLERSSNVPADNFYCYVCHANFEYDEPLVSAHEEAEVGCAACHGPSEAHRSDEDNVTPPDFFYRRSQIEGLCLTCHSKHEEREPPTSLEYEGPLLCVDCHGEHRTPGQVSD